MATPDYRAALGDSQQEFPAYDQFGVADPELVSAYELALRLHEARFRVIPRVIAVPTPAAGAEFSQTVDQGVVWIPVSLVATLTTSAAVGNRAAGLSYSDGTRVFARFGSASVVAASLTAKIGWSRDLGTATVSAVTGTITQALGHVPLFGGAIIASVTDARDVADQWSAIALYVIELQESGWQERARTLREIVTGSHSDLYPGIERGL